MNDLFRPYLRHLVLVFLDDILVYSPTMDCHRQHLRTTLGLKEDPVTQNILEQLVVDLNSCLGYSLVGDTLMHKGRIVIPDVSDSPADSCPWYSLVGDTPMYKVGWGGLYLVRWGSDVQLRGWRLWETLTDRTKRKDVDLTINWSVRCDICQFSNLTY
ncbi:hypothetical protein E3N88_28577 [Mikania micrantha]|uniref:Reverse transcriptase domain-containing protein n=1 Tax=Mikania micrantha TaxID=192012 RepID=A0A5N6N0V5_9ASTR|nr:hypothetical protein E3N88_28577 [Mikania micrantha]